MVLPCAFAAIFLIFFSPSIRYSHPSVWVAVSLSLGLVSASQSAVSESVVASGQDVATRPSLEVEATQSDLSDSALGIINSNVYPEASHLPKNGVSDRGDIDTMIDDALDPSSQSVSSPTSIYNDQPTAPSDTHVLNDHQNDPTVHSPAPQAYPHDIKPILDDIESDSPLDNVRFMSFEEWKKDNLEKAGQSLDAGNRQARATGQGRRPNVHKKGFDSFGEEGEIDIGFSGFEDQEGGVVSDDGNMVTNEQVPEANGESRSGSPARSKQSEKPRRHEAGVTSKSRFNYASDDCAATVMKTNPEAKSSSAVLIEHKDSYMLNVCGAPNKFIIVELCDDILVDTIVLANLEFFSSIFRAFRVSVSDRYPVRSDRWKVIGTFEARNARELQAFPIENPLIWARYLRVELISHYGHEFYCPITLLRVHGTTMMEEFRYQEAIAQGEDDGDDDAEPEGEGDLVNGEPDGMKSAIADERPTVVTSRDEGDNTRSKSDTGQQASATPASEANGDRSRTSTDPDSSSQEQQHYFKPPTPPSMDTDSEIHNLGGGAVKNIAGLDRSSSYEYSSDPSEPELPPSASDHSGSGTLSVPVYPGTPVGVHSPYISSSSISSSTPSSQHQSNSHHGSNSRASSTSTAIPIPTTQESFFKSIHKRLLTLETNSTLSLQYMDAQSQMLKDAFAQVESRQMTRTDRFLEQVNTSVVADLHALRLQYDLLWETTVTQLNSYRDRHAHDMLALSTRLSLVADELVFQKRLAVVQATLLLACLGLVIFVRISVFSAVGASRRSGRSAGLETDISPQAIDDVDSKTQPIHQGLGVRGTARQFFHSIMSPSASPIRSPMRHSKSRQSMSLLASSPVFSSTESPVESPAGSPFIGSVSPSPLTSNLRYYHPHLDNPVRFEPDGRVPSDGGDLDDCETEGELQLRGVDNFTSDEGTPLRAGSTGSLTPIESRSRLNDALTESSRLIQLVTDSALPPAGEAPVTTSMNAQTMVSPLATETRVEGLGIPQTHSDEKYPHTPTTIPISTGDPHVGRPLTEGGREKF